MFRTALDMKCDLYCWTTVIIVSVLCAMYRRFQLQLHLSALAINCLAVHDFRYYSRRRDFTINTSYDSINTDHFYDILARLNQITQKHRQEVMVLTECIFVNIDKLTGDYDVTGNSRKKLCIEISK